MQNLDTRPNLSIATDPSLLQQRAEQMRSHSPSEVEVIERGLQEGRVSKNICENALGHTLGTEALAYCISEYPAASKDAVEIKWVMETCQRMRDLFNDREIQNRALLATRHPEVDMQLLVRAFCGGAWSMSDVVFALGNPGLYRSIASSMMKKAG